MAKFCSKCGSENDDFAQNCISCGSPLTISAGSITDTPEKKRLYLQGMMNLRYYTIVGFLALVAGIVLDFVFMRTLSYGYLVGPIGAAFGGVSLNTANVGALLVYSEITLIVSAVLTLIGVFMLYRGFAVLKSLDPEFSVGRTGAMLEFIGMILVVLGVIALLAIVLPSINLGSATTTASISPSEIGTLLGIALLVLIAAILLLIGVIMVLIGLFRVGSHFNNSLVKIGAILTIFLGIVGTILLFIGFTDIIKQLKKSIGES
ncbi:MAG: DUF973 family protein [Candidatus Thermoplasmatota archaeon]|jgi:hypothetical protein|nr:DUF973 family protein [Candidatus Thermoplasmatota archaeon]MCL5955694.1 DUF973 family protein [Candidatus Thermoplasmatota archaeon]